MSLVIPVALPRLLPVAPSLARTAAPRRRRRRPVAADDRDRFRRGMRGVRSYRPTSLAVNRVDAPALADDDLDGLGRFRGFRGLRKILPKPKMVLKMAALGPAALLHKARARISAASPGPGPGAFALIGAPALLLNKRNRSRIPGLSKLASKGRMIGSMFGKGGGAVDDGGEQPPEPRVDPSQSISMAPEAAAFASSGSGAPASLQYGSEAPPPDSATWPGPPYVAEPTSSSASMSEPAQPYEAFPAADAAATPAFEAAEDAMPADAGSLIYDPSAGLYQSDAPAAMPTDG